MSKNKLKILRITNRFNVGGPTYNVAYLSRYLPDYYETTLIGGNVEPFEESSSYILEDLGVPFDVVPDMYRAIHPARDLKALLYIKNLVDTLKPDIVHTHAAKAGALGRMAAFLSSHKVPVVVHTYHGSIFEGYFSPVKARVFLEIERFLARKSTAIVAISDLQKNDLVHKYRIAPADKIHVIPLGFDLDRFSQDMDSKRQRFRSEFQVHEQDVVVTITGRLTAIKNHELFLRVIHQTQKATIRTIRAFIVGDGEEKEHLMNYCDQLGLCYSTPEKVDPTVTIHFTSWRKDIDVINAGSDIVMLTSKNEGTPVSIIEAMASGKAVISTDVGGVRDIIDHEVSGFIAMSNETELSEFLLEIIANPINWVQIGEKAKQTITGKFNYSRLISDIDGLYRGLIKQSEC